MQSLWLHMGVNQPLADSRNVKFTRKQIIGNHSFDGPEALYHLTKAGSLGERIVVKDFFSSAYNSR